MTPTNEETARIERIAALNDAARLRRDPTAKITFTQNCLNQFASSNQPDNDKLLQTAVIQSEILKALADVSFEADSPEHDFCEIAFRNERVCRVGAARRRAAPP